MFNVHPLCRGSALTELRISGGWLMRPPQLPMQATALQKLVLYGVCTNSELIQGICKVLPSLNDLRIDLCLDDSKESRICSGPATGWR